MDFPPLSSGTLQDAFTSATAAHPPAPAHANGLSAAERLQRQHHANGGVPGAHLSYEERAALEHAEDQRQRQQPSEEKEAGQQPDLESVNAFPCLGVPSTAPKTVAGWGSGPALSARLNVSARPQNGRWTAAVSPAQSRTETLVLMSVNISIGPVPPQYRERGQRAAGEKREEDPKTLLEVLRVVQRRHPHVTIDSSTSRDRVTLLLRTPLQLPQKALNSNLTPEERIARARQELVARVARKITITVNIPASVKPLLIGAKGKTLRAITESTGAMIQVPPREAPDTIALDGQHGAADEEESDEATVPITISGEAQSVAEARAHVEALVRERTSRTTERITTIPKDFYLLLNGARGSKMHELVIAAVGAEGAEDVSVAVPPVHYHRAGQSVGVNGASELAQEDSLPVHLRKRDDAIVVSGHRDLVAKVIEAIHAAYVDLQRTTKKLEIELPKRQHRFLVGQNAEDILEATGSVVEVGPAFDPSEKVIIRGEQMANVQALNLVLEKANSMRVDTIDLISAHRGNHDGVAYAKAASRFLLARGKLRSVQESHQGVRIFLPRAEAIGSHSALIEVVGKDQAEVERARMEIAEAIKRLPPAGFLTVEIDSMVHSHLIGKKGNRIRSLREGKAIDVVFPPEAEQRSDVLLVYAPAADEPYSDAQAAETLQAAKAELERLAKEAADIQTIVLTVAAKLHPYILGPGGSTINAIVGEQRLVSVQVGQDPPAVDTIVVRGPSEEVARVKKELERLAGEALHNDVINSYTTEFDIDSKHVSFIIGKSGTGVNKIRDDLAVRIDFTDVANDGAAAKKRKAKTTVTIKGRKEGVEEAKKRILAQAERLADEVALSIPLAAGIERGAIMGKGGRYVTRLQETHSVFINLPKQGEEGNITIRGPKKGAEAAKKELVELMEYEKEQGFTATLTVSAKSVARILGRNGQSVDNIKEETGVVSVDVERAGDSANITIRGTPKATAEARKKILAIASEVDDEDTVTMSIDPAYHQTLIGRGGSKLREMAQKVGGSASPRMVHFPRQGSDGPPDCVTLRGPSAIIKQLQAALEREVSGLKDRVCVGVAVPRAALPSLIGRAASGLKDLQSKHGVAIHPPGWREWALVGEPTNADDFSETDAADIVKIVGPAAACEAAAEDIKARTQARPIITRSIDVPVSLHGTISQQGRLFRDLPRGARIQYGDGGGLPSPSEARRLPPKREVAPAPEPSARIDAEDAVAPVAEGLRDWQVHQLEPFDTTTTIAWHITANSEEEAAKVEKSVQAVLDKALKAEYLAYATINPDHMARVVGRGGSGIARLNASGAIVDVAGKRGSDTITVMGSLEQVNKVKSGLEQVLSS